LINTSDAPSPVEQRGSLPDMIIDFAVRSARDDGAA
jgi:hypothetical protein